MSLRALPRAQQVDGVVKSMLGGQVSVGDARGVDERREPDAGEGGAANDVNGMAVIDERRR